MDPPLGFNLMCGLILLSGIFDFHHTLIIVTVLLRPWTSAPIGDISSIYETTVSRRKVVGLARSIVCFIFWCITYRHLIAFQLDSDL